MEFNCATDSNDSIDVNMFGGYLEIEVFEGGHSLSTHLSKDDAYRLAQEIQIMVGGQVPPSCKDYGRCNCMSGHCEKGLST